MRFGKPTTGKRQVRASSEDRLMARTGWTLALMTGLLLFGLVVGMGSLVYLRARSDLLKPVQSLVRARALQEATNELIENDTDHTPSIGPGTGAGRVLVEPVLGGVYVYVVNPVGRLTRASLGGPNGANVPSLSSLHSAVTSHSGVFSTVDTESGRYLMYTLPVYRRGHLLGLVQTATSRAQYEDSLSALLQILIVAGILGLVATVGITYLVVRRALHPIRRALRRQRDFVADAAHELRTPLTVIRSVAEAGIGQGTGQEPRRAEMTLKQTLHLTRLVGDLSLLARADSGRLDFEQQPVELDRLAAEVVSDIELLAEDREVQVISNLAPDIIVSGDGGRLRQVLIILLDNALRHTPDDGTISVSLDHERKEAVIRVADSGPGIPPEELSQVFRRFYRSDNARSGEGTGLGLAIAQSITEALGGRIWAGNAAAGGAVLTVAFPLAPAKVSTALFDAEQAHGYNL